MAKTDNLGDFLKDVADSIRTKTGTTELINAQNFSDKILNISSGGDNTLKNLLDATKTTKYLFSSYEGDDIPNLIKYNDTSEVTNMSYMYQWCKATNFPQLNMSKVTNVSYMFYNCKSIVTGPILNLSNISNCDSVFRGCSNLTTCEISDFSNATTLQGLFADCIKLINIPSQLITPKNETTAAMFYGCGELTTAPEMDTSNVTNMYKMFYDCNKLATVPLYDTSKVTNMQEMFYFNYDLETVPAFDCTNVTNMQYIFTNCRNLKSILMTNIGTNLEISASTRFEREDLLIILNNLKTVTSTKTLYMGATNLAKLTDEDKLIATNKGWTLA